jgi:hypothetical protein
VELSVATRRCARDSFEYVREVGLLSEAGFKGNFDDWQLRMNQPVAGEVDSTLAPELADGRPIVSVEFASHVNRMHSYLARNLAQSHRFLEAAAKDFVDVP